jgi:pimeloyl-ACP methyl ester carboxylesterase
MRRISLWSVALLAAATVLTYYSVPETFKEPLLALNRSLSGLEEKTQAIDAHTLHYLEGGRGESVLLLHGIFAEKDHWAEFARGLTDHYHVIAPDLPGYGESGRHAGRRYDYAMQVERLKQFMDTAGIARAHLAGNSMGGTIAALFAVRYPARVASLALIGAPHGISSEHPSEMDRLIGAGQAPLVARNAEEFEAMLQLVFAERPFLPYPIRAASESNAIAHAGSNRRLWDAQLKERYLLQEHVGQVAAPTLALWGSQDKVFDVSGTRTLKTLLPAAQVHTLPGLGHLPMMEAPGETAWLYLDFLRRIPAPREAGRQ